MTIPPVMCPRCGRQVKAGKFCVICGAALDTATRQDETSVALFTLPSKITAERAKELGEANKVALFGLASRRTLFGKKPEEYIVLQGTETRNKVYAQVHGVYAATFAVGRVFSLEVGQDTVEVEAAGAKIAITKNGLLELPTTLRKQYRQEATVVFDSQANETELQLPPLASLERCASVPPDVKEEDLSKLVDVVLALAKKVLEFRIQKVPGSVGTIEREDLDLSDHGIILSPYYLLTFVNSKTGESKNIAIDAVTGAPS